MFTHPLLIITLLSYLPQPAGRLVMVIPVVIVGIVTAILVMAAPGTGVVSQ